jgi:hypothetical protein
MAEGLRDIFEVVCLVWSQRYVEECVRKRVAEVMYEQEERARSVRPRLADRIASAPAELGPSGGEGAGDKCSLAFRHDCT